MTVHDMLLRLLPLLFLSHLCLAVIDNRKPDANYVIPINRTEKAEIYCVSYFAKTIIQEVTGPNKEDLKKLECQKCSLEHVRYRCCRVVKWSEIEKPLTLRCTSVGLGPVHIDDDNVPRIHVSVVRLKSELPGHERVPGRVNETLKAKSSTLYYCHYESDVTELTAGSHIGLGWRNESANSSDPEVATAATPGSSYTERAKQYDQVINDNSQNKEAQFSQLYSNKEFRNLWISDDKKVELLKHNTSFNCNKTSYWLERGSRCLTPSKRALFIMSNCNLVEQIFIVIGVIVLLIISYIVFNLLVWLWNYVWHKSHRNDDDLAVLM